MNAVEEKVVAHLQERFPTQVLGHVHAYGKQLAVTVKSEGILALLLDLKNDPELSFVRLADLAGIDYLGRNEPERYAVVYHLHSFKHGTWVRIRALVPERPGEIDSAHAIWPCAGWLEREVYDMYGIRFRGHPDLRRILMPDDYPAHPLRKDYPLRGQGERNQFRVYDPAKP